MEDIKAITILQDIWSRLQNSCIVSKREFTPESMNELADILNEIAINAKELAKTRKFVREIYEISKFRYIQALERNDFKYYVLFTEGKYIAEMLGIGRSIVIKWDIKNQKYVVTAKSFDREQKNQARRPYIPRSPNKGKDDQ